MLSSRTLLKNCAEDLFYFLCLAIAAGLFLRGFTSYYALEWWDEGSYLHAGITHSPLHLGWGPLYALMYRGLSHFASDPIPLFYLSLAFHATALPLLHFLLSRRLGVSGLYSFLGACLVLLSGLNAPVLIKINHFNLSLLYLILYVASWISNRKLSTAFVGFSTLFAIYLRQDNVIIAAICFLYLFFLVWRSVGSRSCRVGQTAALVLLLLLSGLIVKQVGSPFMATRTWYAFADHFFWAHSASSGTGTAQVRDEMMESTFGKTHSIARAARRNPTAFFAHVGSNLIRLPALFLKDLGNHFPFTTHRKEIFHSRAHLEFYLLIFTLTGVCLFLPRRYPTLADRFQTNAGFLLGLVTLGLGLKSLLAVGLLSPFPRYYLEAVFLSLLWIFALLDFRSGEKRFPLLKATPLLILALLPSHLTAPYFGLVDGDGRRVDPIASVSHFLRGVPAIRRRKWFCTPPYFHYFPEKVLYDSAIFYAAQKHRFKGFRDYFLRSNPDVVILDQATFLPILFHPGETGKSPGEFERLLALSQYEKTFSLPGVLAIYLKRKEDHELFSKK